MNVLPAAIPPAFDYEPEPFHTTDQYWDELDIRCNTVHEMNKYYRKDSK